MIREINKFVKRLSKMPAGDKIILVLSCLAVVGVIVFLMIYFKPPTVSNSHRGSLMVPKPALTIPVAIKGTPKILAVPSLGLSLNVIPGSQDKTGNWTLTWDHVQYATISPLPNNHEGNTVIYGHDITPLFGNLHLIRPGAYANIKTIEGYVFRYKYRGTYTVSPSDMSIFRYHGEPILTLYTCSGTFYQNRQMFEFSFSDVSKI